MSITLPKPSWTNRHNITCWQTVVARVKSARQMIFIASHRFHSRIRPVCIGGRFAVSKAIGPATSSVKSKREHAMSKKILTSILLTCFTVFLSALTAKLFAADQPFYEGKTIRFLIASGPGRRYRHRGPVGGALSAEIPAGQSKDHRPEHARWRRHHRQQLLCQRGETRRL